MAKIREDLVGSVFLSNGTVLRAGDEIPATAQIGEHLIAEEAPKPKTRRSKSDDSED